MGPNARLKGSLLAAVLVVAPACAGDLRLGFGLGFGGAGISKLQSTTDEDGEATTTTVNRAQRPGVVVLQADYLVHRDITVSMEHSRGFTLGPFASSVSFTGFTGRYYLFGAPVDSRTSDYAAVLRFKRFTFFAGLGIGVARGKIIDAGDLVPEVSSSGVYLGYKLGAEYLLTPGMGIRPEVSYQATLFSSSRNPAQLKEFSLQCGLFFFL